MKQFLKDLWFGEPVIMFSTLAAAGTALVAFTDLPAVVDAIIVGIQAIGGSYGTRKLTSPAKKEKLSPKRR